MSSGEEPGHLHPVPTRNQHWYFFHDKHHGRGGPEASRWATDLSELEEFAIFDQADSLELSDESGNLYGLRLGEGGPQNLRDLGTLGQVVAKFPWSHPGQPWHGFPLAPIQPVRPPHPPDRRVPKAVLRTMQERGLLNDIQRRRLQKGRHP